MDGGQGVPSRSILNPGVDNDEGTAQGYTPLDVWVIQYNGTTDQAVLVGQPRYVDLTKGSFFQGVVSTADNTLVFVANTHDTNLEFGDVSTLGLMKLACKTIRGEADCYGNNLSTQGDLVMSGKYEGPVTTSAITVNLFRNVARLDFTLRNGPASGLTLRSIQLCRVPQSLYYVMGGIDRGGVFPLFAQYLDYPPELLLASGGQNPGTEQSFTFYLPSNAQGVNSLSTSSKTKPLHAPASATYLRVLATDAQGRAYVYKIYPGANMVNDYNLLPGSRYVVDFAINSPGDASSDGRVEDYGITDLACSNSFIMNPPPMGTAPRVFTFPIDQVNEFWAQADPALTLGSSDTWTAELVWQDSPQGDMVRFVDPDTGLESITLSGRGPDQRIGLVIRPGGQGNAVIGIKKTGHQEAGYLWSWHLWITDYNPEHRAAPDLRRHIYPVTGGHLHRYAGPAWTSDNGVYRHKYIMDRHLGARNTSYTTVGVLFYQFGRKDPLPISSNYGNIMYDIQGNRLPNDDPRNPQMRNVDCGKGVTLAMGVLNPTVFYMKNSSNGSGDWCSQGVSGEEYSWNNTIKGKNLKSLYDPCPTGWKVPLPEVWADFVYQSANPAISTTLHTERDNRLGWKYTNETGIRYWPLGKEIQGDILYPAVGIRYVHSGVSSIVSTESHNWSSIAPATHAVYSLTSNGAYLTAPNRSARGQGFTVRCVQQ